jgi:hypothetical protein
MLESISVALVRGNLRTEIDGKTTQPGLRLHEDGEAYHEDEHQDRSHVVTNGGSTGRTQCPRRLRGAQSTSCSWLRAWLALERIGGCRARARFARSVSWLHMGQAVVRQALVPDVTKDVLSCVARRASAASINAEDQEHMLRESSSECVRFTRRRPLFQKYGFDMLAVSAHRLQLREPSESGCR